MSATDYAEALAIAKGNTMMLAERRHVEAVVARVESIERQLLEDPEPEGLCEYCEEAPAEREFHFRDPQTGYRSSENLCLGCARRLGMRV